MALLELDARLRAIPNTRTATILCNIPISMFVYRRGSYRQFQNEARKAGDICGPYTAKTAYSRVGLPGRTRRRPDHRPGHDFEGKRPGKPCKAVHLKLRGHLP